MSQRVFRSYQIGAGGTPQPVLGSYLTAAVAVGGTVLTVNDITPFTVDGWNAPYVLVQKVSGLGSIVRQSERLLVTAIDVANKKITVQNPGPEGPGVRFARTGAGGAGVADWVSLACAVNSIYIQTLDGNAAAMFIGMGPTMAKTGNVLVIARLLQVGAGTQPTEFVSARGGAVDADDICQLFIDGTTADAYIPSFNSI